MNKSLIFGLLIAVISFTAAWHVQGWRMGERIAVINQAASDTLLAISVTAATKQQELQNELDEKQNRWAVIEAEQHSSLREAEIENDNLRTDVAAGRKRLLVNASCPARSGNVSETSTNAGVGERARPELNPDAQPTYNSLRDGIVTLEAQVAYLKARCE